MIDWPMLVVAPDRDAADRLRFPLVDHNVDVRKVQVAHTLAAAMAAAARVPPRLVLLDPRLPDAGPGPAVAGLRGACPLVPLLVVVDAGDPEGVLQALRAGAHEVIERAHVSDDLPAAVQRTLARCAHEQGLHHAAAAAQAQEALEALGRLAAGTALEVNNALAVAETALAELGGGGSDAAPLIEAALLRVRDAMATLVAVGRRADLRPERIDLDALLEGLLPMLAQEGGPGVQIDRWLLPGLPPVWFDRAALTQGLLQLGRFARLAMPQGGELRLRGRLAPAGDRVELTCTDTGPTPTAEELGRALLPFSGVRGDGGPGLALLKGIVEQSQGSVELDAAPEGGTRLRLVLPVAAPEPARPRPPARPAAAHAGRGETILVLEDEPTLRRLLGRALREAGYRVLVAGDGASALAVAGAAERVDLLLTDLVLPGQRLELTLDALRRQHPDLQVVLMTGAPGLVDPPEGAADAPLLRKPFRMAVLLEQLRGVLDAPAP